MHTELLTLCSGKIFVVKQLNTPKFRIFLATALLFGAVPPTLQSATTNLPQMGEPVDQQLSPYQEQKIGKEFMRQARFSLPLIADNELNEYIQLLGERLLTGLDGSDFPFTFFLLDENTINAFAVPGGYIAVNSGLINTFRTEGQLASVIAHEIAHVTQRHHARAYSNQGNSGLTTAATIIAAILIGQKSPEAGQAALATGIGLSQQSRINYTRSNEYEADRIGVDILMNAGFSSVNMAEAFDILKKNSTLNTSGLQLEYLQTHPLNENRIAEARSRADLERDSGVTNSVSFELFRTRLRILTNNDHAQLRHALTASVNKNSTQSNVFYGLALIDTLAGKLDSASDLIKSLPNLVKQEYFVQTLSTKINYLKGDEVAATAAMRDLIALHPSRFSVVSQLASLQATSGQLDRAYSTLAQYIRRTPSPKHDVYKQLADVQQRRGNQTGSHESLATYYELNGNRRDAIQQLDIALRSVKTGSNEELRINARLKTLKK